MRSRSLVFGLASIALFAAASLAQERPPTSDSSGVTEIVQPVTVQQKEAPAVQRFAIGAASLSLRALSLSLKVISFGAVSFARDVDARSCGQPGALSSGCERYIVSEAQRLRSLAQAADSSRLYQRRE